MPWALSVLGLGSWVLGLGSWVLGLWFWVLDLGASCVLGLASLVFVGSWLVLVLGLGLGSWVSVLIENPHSILYLEYMLPRSRSMNNDALSLVQHPVT